MWGDHLHRMNIRNTAQSLAQWGLRWGRVGRDLLLPPHCVYCEDELEAPGDELLLCKDCRNLLGPTDWKSCRRCGAPVDAGEAGNASCARCHTVEVKFDAAISLGAYQGHLRSALLRMKRPRGQVLAMGIGRLLSMRRGAELASLCPNLVVPVPMHWRRRWVQGVNSPDLLAECLARALAIPVAAGALCRARNTMPQANLPPKRRFSNVRGAFAVRSGYDLAGVHVLLVDDILTTGATCSEAARMLKQAGAASVSVAIVARALGENGQP